MSESDSRTIPLAVGVPSPSTTVDVTRLFRPLITDPFGALWNALGDPVTGNPVGTVQILDGVVTASKYALVTAAGVFGRDAQAGTPNLSVVDALEVNVDGTVAGALASTRGISATAALLLTDPNFLGQFAAAQRGFLQVDAQPDDRVPLLTLATLSMLNTGGSFDRVASANTNDDDVPTSGSNWLRGITASYLFDGDLGFDRAGSASATNLAAQTGMRAQLAAAPGEWTLAAAPAANTIATATRAAGGVGVRHVLRSINATLIGVAAIAAPITIVVRDGASGVGAILWQDRLFAAAAGSKDRVTLGDLNIVGSDNADLTIEFLAAPGATNFQAVAATGYSGV